MSKMGSHDPFRYLKHKLWPKERSRVVLISLHAGGLPHTIGKLLTRATILLRLHFNQGFAHKVMGFQSCGSPNFENFEAPIWESHDKMTFGCWPYGQAQRIL